MVLVSRLLSGTFDARSCHSDCVWGLYWSAFWITVAGCVAGVLWLLRQDDTKPLFTLISVGAMVLLLVVFVTTMGIGTFA